MNVKQLTVMMLSFLFGLAGCAQDTAKFTSQTNAEFARTIAVPGVQLIDVRTSGEFASGHIPGAVNIDVNGAGFMEKAAALDKKNPVALYCRSGSRSKTAARMLSAQGFEVYELNRGIMNWDGKTEK